MLKLIDINLLPEKEKKSSLFIYSLAFILVLFFIGSLFFFFSLRNMQAETERTQDTISQTRLLMEVQQTKLLDAESTQGMKELEKTIAWMTDYPVDTVPVLNELISLLPSRGFIQTLEYSGRQSIIASIQFDSSREAAYYLHHLKDQEWITEGEILEITTDSLTGEETDALESGVVPRYLAEFSLTLDAQILQEINEAEDPSIEEEAEE
ncbi:hypothetical protein CN378_15400 [Bacillus sp. AFS015802]|uniref:hypothetical protein n=1 Tax=Bacillus sp. AFS015802 TaxID=2033486 RepID=UPI000BF43A5A|nr:hypothetical protein [Bacillus sp. AFS015802]PFA64565.1 hypothetical protein CN378_15400 [Bacillus sp. AFS015802]